VKERGRIPIGDFHKSSSEGEGACSRICDGRSHLPLRGKLGWMTPRAGQKKAGKRNASFGALVPKRGPLFYSGGLHLDLRNSCHRLDTPQHRNPRFPEHVRDFSFL